MITAFFVFLLGTVFGSFSSAILHRTRYGGSVLKGRSKCVSCARELSAVDLVPVVSWLVRRGRCRQCKAPVSWQYLALELGMGALFLAAYYRAVGTFHFGPQILTGAGDAARLAVFCFLLALVFVYDARYGEIPDSFSITGIVAGLLLNLTRAPNEWWYYLLAMGIGAGFFGLQYALGRGKWVGSGDIILGAMLGAMVGWPGIFATLFFSYLIGLAYVIALLLVGRKKMNDTIPLGPFLVAGALIVLLTNAGSLLYGYAI